MTHKKIQIYTDGSCKGNPGPGGWAAIILEGVSLKPLSILKGNERATTNNRMEMTGVIEALHFLRDHHLESADIKLFSDSNLIIQTLLQGWKRKANLDLWEELDDLNEGMDIDYIWVKGHAKNKWNNECDKVAQREADIMLRKIGHSGEYSSANKETATHLAHIKKSEKKVPHKNISKSKSENIQQELF